MTNDARDCKSRMAISTGLYSHTIENDIISYLSL